MLSAHIVIPARYASTRLPGKPLALIGDKPMIQHVYERCVESGVGDVIVATDDARIDDAVSAFGGVCFLTSADHQTGTDRIHEVAERSGWADDDIVVNVQGDEPFIPSEVIAQVADNLDRHPAAGIATVCAPFNDMHSVRDENAVKVVRDDSGFALYFSRSAIPGFRADDEPGPELFRRHIGIYAYRVSALRTMATAQPHPIENVEKLEQLRFLALGGRIHCADTLVIPPVGVDTPEDLAKAERYYTGG